MTIIGWSITVLIVILITASATILCWKAPQSPFWNRLFAITPILLGLFLLLMPRALLVTKDHGILALCIGYIMPFACMLSALPLVIKVNKKMNKA